MNEDDKRHKCKFMKWSTNTICKAVCKYHNKECHYVINTTKED